MSVKLKPYPEYQNSGVSWLGSVPEHWKLRRFKNLFREKEERSGNGSGLLLSLMRARGLLPQSEASNRISFGDLTILQVGADHADDFIAPAAQGNSPANHLDIAGVVPLPKPVGEHCSLWRIRQVIGGGESAAMQRIQETGDDS